MSSDIVVDDSELPDAESPDIGTEPGPDEGYWVESRQPLAASVFIMPLLVAYEVGVLVLGPEVARNGADAWLRQILDHLGFTYYFLLPVLTVGCLLGWHHVTRRPWRVRKRLVWFMAAECVALSLCLRLVLLLQAVLFQIGTTVGEVTIRDSLGTAVGFLGAGIYEELLFRLILLSSTIATLRWLRLGPYRSLVVAVVLVSFLFAAAHYVGPYGDELDWFTFLFRFLAGIFFSALFLRRGFGIAAGSHAGYNMLVGLTGAW